MPRRRRFITNSEGVEEPANGLQGDFARRLNRAIMNKGWTQSELTRRMNDIRPEGTKPFGRHLVSAYVRGENTPYQGTLEIMAKVLEVPLADLVPVEEITVVGAKKLPVEVTFYDDDTWHIKVDARLPTNVAVQIQKLVNDGMKSVGSTPRVIHGYAVPLKDVADQGVDDSSEDEA